MNKLDGYSQDELLAIGTRKTKLSLPMSATDINAPMTYMEGIAARQILGGCTEQELKDIGSRQGNIMGFATSDEINKPHLNQIPADAMRVLEDLEIKLSARGVKIR